MTESPQSTGKRVCMITHSFYESDNRVIRYAESLAQRGDAVDVVALRRSPDLAKVEVLSGVRVFRIQDRFGKREQSKTSFLRPLLRFLLASSAWLTRRHHRHRYHLVHVHNIPDFLVFAAWYPRLTGAKIILDIHDIVPEFFGSKFGARDRSALVWGLKFVEKLSAAFAHRVILANHLWLDKYTARSARKEKCSVFLNHVDSRVFQPACAQAGQAGAGRPQPEANTKGKVAWPSPPSTPVKGRGPHGALRPLSTSSQREGGGREGGEGENHHGHRPPVILFPGGLQWHQGLDIAIRAFDKLLRRLPNAQFHIYGDGIMKPELINLAQALGLNAGVRFFQPLPLKQIASVMAAADLGVVPKRADSFGNEAYSTKIMEFMSVGVPVVVSSTKIDRFYFDDSVVRFFESGNPDALAEAMFEVLNNAELRRQLVARASVYVARHSWENRKGDYLQLVDSLCAPS